MFTSRAEHRLILGVDSARERLMPEGRRLGLVREGAFHVERERWRRRRRAGTELAAGDSPAHTANIERRRQADRHRSPSIRRLSRSSQA